MNHALALKLKQNGYPQHSKWVRDRPEIAEADERAKIKAGLLIHPYVPDTDEVTEELLGICQEYTLHVYPHGVVVERPDKDDMPIQPTALEALCYLWLELNKHGNK